jgi:enoyl-CoA hydratase/carnithine racemase
MAIQRIYDEQELKGVIITGKGDKAFAENAGAQLDFVYRNSIYWEKEYMRYPVYRVVPNSK